MEFSQSILSFVRDCLTSSQCLGWASVWDSRTEFKLRRRPKLVFHALIFVSTVLILLMLHSSLQNNHELRRNSSANGSNLSQLDRPNLPQQNSSYPFNKFLWRSFCRFIDPHLHTIHVNAIWFALSLLTEKYDTLDPSVRNEQLEDKLFEQLKLENITIATGGYYQPDGGTRLTNCDQVNQTLTIMIPYRNRAHNLLAFLSYMHRYLPLKSVQYRIVVLEQANWKAFNRAKLFNAGLRELGLLIEEGRRPFAEDISTLHNCTSYCFVLHDVDKMPVSMETPYACLTEAFQLARIGVALNKSALYVGKHRLQKGESEYRFYRTFFGGVSIVSRSVIQQVNGLSNLFFGWGGEDDDFQRRIAKSSIPIKLNQLNLSRFYYLEHENDSPYNSEANFLLADHRVWTRMRRDGIRQTRYTVRDRIVRPLYTLYYIDL